MRRRVHVLAACAALTLWIAARAEADGMAFHSGSFAPLEQGEQRAAIAHADGLERMVIAIDLELDDQTGAFWLFPVPGTPGRTKIDVIDTFPTFRGRHPGVDAQRWLEGQARLARATQLYPLLVEPRAFPGKEGAEKARVHAELERWGIRAEALTAHSLEGLAAHLAERELRIAGEHLQSFAPYLGGEHVLVAVWVASREKVLAEFPHLAERERRAAHRRPCLWVEFPTERPFYPLRATRGYGDAIVPVKILVVGHYRVASDRALAERARTLYRAQSESWGRRSEGRIEGFPEAIPLYTQIELKTQAGNLVDDLWLEPGAPSGVRYALRVNAVAESWLGDVTPFVVIAVLSYLAAGVAGLVLFRRWRGYAWLGLANLLTLGGMVVASHLVFRRRGEEERLGRKAAFAVYILLLVLLVLGLRTLSLSGLSKAQWVCTLGALGLAGLLIAIHAVLHRRGGVGKRRGAWATATFAILFSITFVLLSAVLAKLAVAPL